MPPAGGFQGGGSARRCLSGRGGRFVLGGMLGRVLGGRARSIKRYDGRADSQPAQLYRQGEKLLVFGNMNVEYSHQAGWEFAGFADSPARGGRLAKLASEAAPTGPLRTPKPAGRN
jgi:hypothetical protein